MLHPALPPQNKHLPRFQGLRLHRCLRRVGLRITVRETVCRSPVLPLIHSLSVSLAAPQDPHHVAQELEVYLIRSEGEAGYMAVARLGVNAAELKLMGAELSREQVKQMMQRVARDSTQ